MIIERNRYVLGLAFDDKYQKLLLLNKKHGSRFPNVWNGIGGEVKIGQTAIEAMNYYTRIYITQNNNQNDQNILESKWDKFFTMNFPDRMVDCFVSNSADIFNNVTAVIKDVVFKKFTVDEIYSKYGLVALGLVGLVDFCVSKLYHGVGRFD